MTEKIENEEALTKLDRFDELPDAPPKRSIKLSWVGKMAAVVVIFWLVIIAIGPSIAPYHEMDDAGDDTFMNAYDNFYLGTDYFARDTLSRILFGARNTIGISLLGTLLAYLIGITLGIAAAVKGGLTDTILSRFNDAILSLPSIMLGLLAITAFIDRVPIVPLIIVTSAVIYASSVYRIARALGQDIMVQDYVEAAKARGEGLWWIIRSEVLPNAAMPLATDFGLRLVFVVLFVSSLSFLGLGIQPPASDWGSMVKENLAGLAYGSYAAIWPALAIASFTIAVNLIVDDISAKSGGSLAKKMV